MYQPCKMQTNQSDVNPLGEIPSPYSPLNGGETMEGFTDLSQTFKFSTDDDLTPTDRGQIPSPYSDSNTCQNGNVDPDSFLTHHEQRSRLYSTSSWGSSPTSWAASPYTDNGVLSPQTPSPFSPNNDLSEMLIQHPADPKPDMGRQTSLSMALEVLGGIEKEGFVPNYPLTPESYTEEEHIHAPFKNYITPNSAPARQRSTSGFAGAIRDSELFDDNSRTRAFSADNAFEGAMDVDDFLRSINVIQDNKDVNTNNNNNYVYAVTSINNIQSTSSTTTSEITSLNVTDIHEMLNEIQKPLPETSKPRPSTTELAKFIGSDHDYSAPQKVLAPEFQPSPTPVILPQLLTSSPRKSPKKPLAQKPSTSQTIASPTSVVVDLTTGEAASASNTDVGSLERSSSYKRKRARNNESCKVSRKRKKNGRSEAENKLQFLAEDNDAMRIKIVELEKEVQETRSILLRRMTGKAR